MGFKTVGQVWAEIFNKPIGRPASQCRLVLDDTDGSEIALAIDCACDR